MCHCLLCHCLLCHCLLCHSVALGITDWTRSTDPLTALPQTSLLQRGQMWNEAMRVILGTTKDTQFLAVYVKAINWTRSLLVSRGWGRGRCGRLFIRDRSIDQHWSPAKCHLQMSFEVGPSARRPAVIPRPWSARSQSPLALGQQFHSHHTTLVSAKSITTRPWCQ